MPAATKGLKGLAPESAAPAGKNARTDGTAGPRGRVGIDYNARRGHSKNGEEAVRYLVTARVKPGREADLLRAIEEGSLGQGSVAGDEYLRNMGEARIRQDGAVRWVEVCFCPTPLLEERPYWEEFFELVKARDAHARSRCPGANGTEPCACSARDCTQRLQAKLTGDGRPFLDVLRQLACPRPKTA